MISTSGDIIFLSAQVKEMQPWFPKKVVTKFKIEIYNNPTFLEIMLLNLYMLRRLLNMRVGQAPVCCLHRWPIIK